ncbi:mutator type transposase [Tanacetum coccineum]
MLGGRDKAIISTLEFAREYLMKRIVNVNKIIARCDGPLTPTATKLLKRNSYEATKYTVEWGGGIYYQVSGPFHDQCVVNVEQMTCTCRKWELTGIPCKHAVATNWNMSLNHETVGLPEEWCNIPSILLPPEHQPQVGRPQKARRKPQLD